MSNIQNGGLICKMNGDIILGEVTKASGMCILKPANELSENKIMPWFINSDEVENRIYYSDALKENYLCKMELSNRVEQTILTEPVYLLKRYGEQLYYINEKNRYLYSYHLQDRSISQLVSEEVSTFTINEDELWYSSSKGVMHATLGGQLKDRVSKHEAIRLVGTKEVLFFIDKEEDYKVSYIDLKTGEIQTIEGSKATSLNIYGDCVFYNHIKDKSHIYRYSIANEFNIKFIPERADYIHLIEDTMYYLNQDKKLWMKVSVQGGKPIALI